MSAGWLNVCSVDSMDRLKTKCATLESEIRDPSRLKDFYQFAFNYAKNPGQKCLGKKNFFLLTVSEFETKMWYPAF